jgi:hypothetical protein
MAEGACRHQQTCVTRAVIKGVAPPSWFFSVLYNGDDPPTPPVVKNERQWRVRQWRQREEGSILKKEPYPGRILGLLAAILVLPALFWAAYLTLRVVSVGERDEHQPADAIIMLGACEYSGRPSSPCAARLDHALCPCMKRA